MTNLERFFLRLIGDEDWTEVSKAEYAAAERTANFYPQDSAIGTNEPATAYFSDGIIEGRTEDELRSILESAHDRYSRYDRRDDDSVSGRRDEHRHRRKR